MSLLTRVTLPNGALANDSQTFLGAGALFTTGTVLFVCSVTGSDGNPGTDPGAPLATVQQAVTNATANKGWKVIIMPGHAETVTSTSINLSKAGISFICLGSGLERPTFTYNAAASTITVSAANVAFIGGHHIPTFADVVTAFTLTTAKDCKILNNTFVDGSSSLDFLSCVTTNSTNNAADGLEFSNNYVYSLPTTDAAVVSILGNALRVVISNNIVDKAATNNAGHLMTASSKVLGGVRIIGNILTVVGATNATVGILFTNSSTTSSGICADNYVSSLDTTAALIATAGTGISFLQNFLTGVADKSGAVWPVADDPS